MSAPQVNLSFVLSVCQKLSQMVYSTFDELLTKNCTLFGDAVYLYWISVRSATLPLALMPLPSGRLESISNAYSACLQCLIVSDDR